jgi:Predicted 3'-5' exonuclease related to the exonuclease domain of PolB
MTPNYLIVDVASAPMDNADTFLDGEPIEPAGNLKDPEKIAADVAKKRAARLEKAGLDFDLAVLTGVAVLGPADDQPVVRLIVDESDERDALQALGRLIAGTRDDAGDYAPTLVTFNGFKFDLPLLMRRAAYLGLREFPRINLDRYRSPHIDLWNTLSYSGAVSAHGLGFYCRRLGWSDLTKRLSGAEESRVRVTGQWAELEASLYHDVIATRRLAEWLHVLQPACRV